MPSDNAAITIAPPDAAEAALINPVRGAKEEPVAPRVILTFAQPDYRYLCRLIGADAPPRHLWDCAVQSGSWAGQPVSVTSPAMGAPYAVMVLERLIALGARQVWILSWCGSLQPQVRIGSLILPTWALNADGTSPHYLNGRERPAPHPGLAGVLTRRLQVLNGIPWHTGPIWTHDAIYRETASQVQHYQAQGILGVEMELAALFAVGQFRRVPVAGLLVVSDELFSLSYQHGYRQEHFREARELAARLLLAAATGGPHEI